MITFQWKRCDVEFIDTEIVLFPGDAIVKYIEQKKSGVIQIKETKRTFFFWNQEKDIEVFKDGINKIQKIFDGENISAVQQEPEKQFEPLYCIRNGKLTMTDVQLRKIVSADVIKEILKEHPEEVEPLSLMCPPSEVEGKNHDELIEVIVNNIHSNQFQETLRLIENAIQTGEADELCKECGVELEHQGFGALRPFLYDIVKHFKK